MAVRLAIIVPYRDRPDHLRQFVPHMRRYLRDAKLTEYTIHVVEQSFGKPFNRGAIKNIGFKLADPCADYVCFHDVDYLPIKADYSWVDCPTLLISKGTILTENMNTFFGAVVAFSKTDFTKINGYPNAYWQWGFEDQELHERCILTGLTIKRREGVFHALPHVHEGLKPYRTEAEKGQISRQLYVRRKPFQSVMMITDGLSSATFNLLRTDIDNELYHYRVEF